MLLVSNESFRFNLQLAYKRSSPPSKSPVQALVYFSCFLLLSVPFYSFLFLSTPFCSVLDPRNDSKLEPRLLKAAYLLSG